MLYNNVNKRAKVTPLFVFWDGIFNETQLKTIQNMFASTEQELVFTPGIQPQPIRNTENSLIYDAISREIEVINEQHFQFDLYGFDSFSYIEVTPENTVNWEVAFRYNEEGLQTEPIKLVAEFLLNDDFEGGNLEFNLIGEHDPFKCDCVKGRLIVYPSWHLARIGPVKSGTRRSLIFTIKGPRFK